MSYNKLGFTSGQTLKAEHLNHMEEGIANAGSTSWGNITDKPSYLPVMVTANADILPETQLTSLNDGSFFYAKPIEGIEVGNTYTVTYNGVEYTCKAEHLDAGGGMIYTAIGNTEAAFGTTNENGEPFCVVIAPLAIAAQIGYNLLVLAVDGATEVTMAIRGDVMTYTKKLDNKCLDLDWLPIKKSILLLEETIVSNDLKIDELVVLDIASSLRDIKIEVTWDGVVYTVPVTVDEHADYYKYWAGNMHILNDSYEDTGEPFLIFTSTRLMHGPGTTFYAADDNEHTVSVSALLEDINKMPECYLPESVSGIVIRSSTLGSTKKFKLTVDDSGTVTATEI